jgi:hypothetical protein
MEELKMKLVASSYISDIKFEKSYDGSELTFTAREGISKDVMFYGYEENGKMKITGNRTGLIKSVNGENRVIEIEKYITEEYKKQFTISA